MKISMRLLLLFLMLAVLPLALFSYFNLQQDEAALRAEVLGRMSGLADKKVIQIRSYLAEREREVRIQARGPQVIEAIGMLPMEHAAIRHNAAPISKEASLHQYFERYVEETGLFYDMFLINPRGEVIFSHKHEADFATNLMNGPFRDTQLAHAFRSARMTLEPVISGYEHYAPSRAPALFIAAPVMVDGKFKGVFAVQLDNELLYRVATDATGLGQSGEVTFAQRDGDGVLYTTPLKHRADAAMKFRLNLQEFKSLPTASALVGNSGSGIGPDYRGKPVVAAWRYLPELGWGMVVKIDADEVFASIRQQRMLMLEVLAGLVLFTGLLAYYFGRRITVPLMELARTADEVAKGNLDRRADESAFGELGLLARTFNHMAGNLWELYRSLEERIEERTRNLNVSNEQLQEEIIEREHIENELKNSRDQYDRLTTNIPIGVYLLRTTAAGEFSFKYVSARFCAMLGVTAGAVYADSDAPFQAIHPDDLPHFIKLNQAAVQTREPFKWEGRSLVDGSTRWLRIESQPELLDNGDCIWDGVMIDITERKLAQLELQHSQDLLNDAQRIGRFGSWELDMVSGVLRWSDEIYRIFELDPAKFLPSYENFLNVIHPNDRDKVNQAYTQSLEDRQPYDVVHRLLLADGCIKWVREHCNSEFDASGKPLRSVGAVQDITEQYLAEEQLRIAAATFETHDAILITDANANIIRVNHAFQDITGYTSEEVLGKNPRILSSGRQDKAFYAAMWQQLLTAGSWSGEVWDRRKGGQIYPKWLNITVVKNEAGETTEYVAIFSDITARKQAEEEIHNLAFYDALTKLPNRRLLLDRFRLALSVSARSHHYGAVLFLDMDRFKMLNDTLGHDYGDLLLIEVARRIQSCVREVDTVARLGGDEFVVLLEEVDANAEEASQKVALIAEKIRAALAAPYRLKDNEHHSSPSIGVSLYRGNAESVDALLKFADMAMYEAKESGRNAVHFFDPAMQLAVVTRSSIEADLRHAVPDKQLRLYYQIQLGNDHRPLGAEALVRWIHPKRGMVSPAQFIPIAEESSLILDIGHWVLETACRQLAVWGKSEQTRHLELAINVSSQQFRKHDFVENVAAMAHVHQIDPSRLKLELTESVVLTDVADIVAKMHALKALGIKLSLDDFGTGYSSLSYLKQLPLDQLKIDQSFVRDIATDLNDAVMVQTIIGMAKNFRLNVIAEGVETEAQFEFLKQNGCMAYQGYLFSKPVPVEEFEALLGKMM